MNNEISNPKLTQLTLVDLRPAKTYNLCMFATNSEGTSDISNVLSITTKEAGTNLLMAFTDRIVRHEKGTF